MSTVPVKKEDCRVMYDLACAHVQISKTMESMPSLKASNLESIMQQVYTMYLDSIYTTDGISSEYLGVRAFMNETALSLMLAMRSVHE